MSAVLVVDIEAGNRCQSIAQMPPTSRSPAGACPNPVKNLCILGHSEKFRYDRTGFTQPVAS
ncbi:hypothetical protein ACN4EG_24375 [Alkalinema pantanalense CENA528]|uniref:hypothetical protein n=1 Tax=Alkalinema pantanalense TaxID=1620705 RepID=UPI003D6ED8B0